MTSALKKTGWWMDLLGTPFVLHGESASGMDCSTVAEEVMLRLGMTPPPTNPFRADPLGQRDIEETLASVHGSYEMLGRDSSKATKLGDLVLTTDQAGCATCLYVLVDVARGTFLTAEEHRGVRAARRSNLRDIAGVYRLKEKQRD